MNISWDPRIAAAFKNSQFISCLIFVTIIFDCSKDRSHLLLKNKRMTETCHINNAEEVKIK